MTLAPGTFPPPLSPSSFPPGPWNQGYVAQDPTTGSLVFTRTEKVNFPYVKSVWHSEWWDHIKFAYTERLRSNVHRATHPIFDGSVIPKFAVFSWEVLYHEDETTAYASIEGSGIGPELYGHLLEQDRVIGFVLDDVEGRSAGPGDLQVCREALGRLHAREMTHGDINRFNFLVKPSGVVVLLDFETVEKAGKEECEEEMGRLEEALRTESHRGWPGFTVVKGGHLRFRYTREASLPTCFSDPGVSGLLQ